MSSHQTRPTSNYIWIGTQKKRGTVRSTSLTCGPEKTDIERYRYTTAHAIQREPLLPSPCL